MTLNYTAILATCQQIAVHRGLYATSFSSKGKQAEQEVTGKLSDLYIT